jgi:hypothetical protein
MDICLVRRNHYRPEFGLAEHTLERGLEGFLHIYQGTVSPRSESDQGDSCGKRWFGGHLQDRAR